MLRSLFRQTQNNSSNTTVIVFQGPLPNTCGNFWEMVWEQRSRGVVMLNRVIEKGSVSTVFFLNLTVSVCLVFAPITSLPFSLCYLVECAPSLDKMCPILASQRGEGCYLWWHQFQAYLRLRRRQILLHSPSAGVGKPVCKYYISSYCV